MLLAWWHGRNSAGRNSSHPNRASSDPNRATDTNIHGRLRASFHSLFAPQSQPRATDDADQEVKELSAHRPIAELAVEREAVELRAGAEAGEVEVVLETGEEGVVLETGEEGVVLETGEGGDGVGSGGVGAAELLRLTIFDHHIPLSPFSAVE